MRLLLPTSGTSRPAWPLTASPVLAVAPTLHHGLIAAGLTPSLQSCGGDRR
jgi:hypothetical protein